MRNQLLSRRPLRSVISHQCSPTMNPLTVVTGLYLRSFRFLLSHLPAYLFSNAKTIFQSFFMLMTFHFFSVASAISASLNAPICESAP